MQTFLLNQNYNKVLYFWVLSKHLLINNTPVATSSIFPNFIEIDHSTTSCVLIKNQLWGNYTSFCKSMIIRGIGYRAFIIDNDFGLQSSISCRGDLQLINFIIQTSSINDMLLEDFEELYYYWVHILKNEFPYSRYLIIRAGHTNDMYIPLESNIFIKTSKRDRKLVIFGSNKQKVNRLSYDIYKYRKPSVYTGRGVRRKHLKPLRKAGKKDKQRGRVF